VPSLQPRLSLNGNCRNTSYMKKIHNYEPLQHYTYPEQNSVNSNSVYFTCIIYVYFPVYLSCIYFLCIFTFCFFSSLSTSHSFPHESALHFFLFCFVGTSLNWFFLLFCFHVLIKHICNHTKFLQINLIHSSVYIGMHFHLYIFFTIFCVCLFS